MGAMEDLAAYLVGADTQNAIKAENPWYQFQAAPDQVTGLLGSLAKPTTSNGQIVAGQFDAGDLLPYALGTGLVSGLFKGLGDNYNVDLTDRYQQAVWDATRGIPVSSDLPASLFARAQTGANLFNTERAVTNALANDQLNRQLSVQQNLFGVQSEAQMKKAVLEGLMKSNDPVTQATTVEAAKKLGVLPADFQLAARTEEPIGGSASELTDYGPDLGIPTLEAKEAALFRSKRNAGVPAEQAEVSARNAVQELRKRNKDLNVDSLKTMADSISQTEEIIRKGEEGIANAGVTGSRLGSAWEKTLGAISPYLGGRFPEAEKQAAGDTLLMQTQQLGASLNRIKGTGAMSDFESRMLFETAMSPTKTQSQNDAILKQYQNGLAIMKEHQGFINYFMDKTGGNPELAQTMWDVYKAENPIVAKDSTGGYTLNEDRTPWQKFDFGSAYKKFISGESSGASDPISLEGSGLGAETGLLAGSTTKSGSGSIPAKLPGESFTQWKARNGL